MASKQDVGFCLINMSMLSMLQEGSAKLKRTFFDDSVRTTKPDNVAHAI